MGELKEVSLVLIVSCIHFALESGLSLGVFNVVLISKLIRKLFGVIVLNLKLVEPYSFSVILLFKLLKSFFVLVDFVSENGVHLLSLKEFAHHIANVSVSSSRLNLEESLLNSIIFFHFLLHLALKELTPELLHHKVIALLDLVSILAVVLSVFSDLGLSVNAIFTLLKGLILVLN
jgi:hypothetical protein